MARYNQRFASIGNSDSNGKSSSNSQTSGTGSYILSNVLCTFVANLLGIQLLVLIPVMISYQAEKFSKKFL